jgi:hypothetical protein
MQKLNLGATFFIRRLQMTKLTINDLNTVEELSTDEAAKISGGVLFLGLAATAAATALVVEAAKAGVFDSISVSDMLKH